MEWFSALPGRMAGLVIALAIPAAAFAALAVMTKGRGAWAAARHGASETQLNLVYCLTDALFVTYPMALLVGGLRGALPALGLAVPASLWDGVPVATTALLAILAGDLIGYWRHRWEHCRALWPAHAIHHSDTAMSWLTLLRFHPVNRFTTTLADTAFLVLLGFPAWAILLNGYARHYYGYFVHADLPWTFGRCGKILVSPVMHRWHHAQAEEARGANFATVFAFYDVLFGTFYCPHSEIGPLGVDDPLPRSWFGQTIYPIRAWAAALNRLGKAASA
jgi:sterol desaturase/sphingolipid hydroxylase (fatty acid hydroxylase superfamily)